MTKETPTVGEPDLSGEAATTLQHFDSMIHRMEITYRQLDTELRRTGRALAKLQEMREEFLREATSGPTDPTHAIHPENFVG